MIIPKNKELNPSQEKEIRSILQEFQCGLQEVAGTTRKIYAILGDERDELMINRIEGLPYIARVDTIQSPYKLMDIKSELSHHVTKIEKVKIKEELLFIAGQCTIDIENPNYFIETAHAVKEAGANVIRGGVWKPRTSPYSYQGQADAIDILLEASAQTGLPANAEVMEEEHVEIALQNKVGMMQIGTRNGLNYSLLRKIGHLSSKQKTLILLKRAMHMGSLNEFISAGEYIVSGGNPNILLCPRGTVPSMDGYRNHPDECITPLLKQKTWAPVIVDPSHSVGKAAYVPHAALAAVAYGADGLVIESHIDPLKGIGDDPKQAITPIILKSLIHDAKALRKHVKFYQGKYISK